MPKIIECVPNFSDGRRPEVYNAIAEAIQRVPGAHVLDVSADADHNRSVITFVGKQDAVEEGAFQAIATAAQLINMEEHEGEHPRIGATDVCPFIPVQGVTVDDCIALAERLGRRVGEELGIAVYLYGAAARNPERKKLSSIRRGQYELWKDEVATNPERLPDFGPALPRPWGATAMGVRPFLIAYNLYLNSDDVKIAGKIAQAVRFTGGGLRHVQALGFLVDGQAQVSMNLTDFSKTPIHRVQEMVRREAARFGLSITRAELIGLIPEKALLDAATWYLQLEDVGDDQVLELRLAREQESDLTPHSFLEATAAGTPTPGGGSTAALAGTLGAALTQMVANLTIGRKKYADVDQQAQDILAQAGLLRQKLTTSIQDDADAFKQVMVAWRDKSKDQADREEAIEQATIHAGEVPLAVAQLSIEVARLAQAIVTIGNVNAVTDAGAAAVMARAAVQVAALNVRINAQSLKNKDLARNWSDSVAALESTVENLVEDTMAQVAVRGGF